MPTVVHQDWTRPGPSDCRSPASQPALSSAKLRVGPPVAVAPGGSEIHIGSVSVSALFGGPRQALRGVVRAAFVCHADDQFKLWVVGNISWEVDEQQLKDILTEVGSVKSLRLMVDKESGKPKGFGFCEFYDKNTAESAVRNLHGHEIGGRQLRVNYADEGSGAERGRDRRDRGEGVLEG
eukprot:gene13182-30668_t